MEDDVRQSSTDRYAVSQAYRWKAERDQARQELDRLRGEVEAMRPRLMPEGMEWLLEVWPRWSNGDYCKFGDWWTAECYGEFEPKQLRKLSIYTPEQLDEFGQGNGKDYGYEWDFFRPSYVTYHPVKVEPPAPKVLAADGKPLEVGQTVWSVSNGIEFTVVGLPKSSEYQAVKLRLDDGAFTGLDPDQLTHERPVLDADGVPIRVGDEVYGTVEGGPFIVTGVSDKGSVFVDAFHDTGMHGSMLTHTKPEPPDSAERIADDIRRMAEEWCLYPSLREASKKAASSVGEATMGSALSNLSKRCKALSERDAS